MASIPRNLAKPRSNLTRPVAAPPAKLLQQLEGKTAKKSARPERLADKMEFEVRKASTAERLQGASASPEMVATRKMRELVQSGKLESYYRAAIGETKDPGLQQAALKLFSDLPTLTRKTSASELVAMGLWTKAPTGLEQLQNAPRFVPGRQVVVETTVNSDLKADAFLAYQEGGVRGRTHRATLVGEKGGSYLVKVDGKAEPLEVPKKELEALNQPQSFGEGSVFKGQGVTADYNSPLMKAKLAEAALKMDPLVSQMDFSAKPGQASSLNELQRSAVRAVFSVLDMKVPARPGAPVDASRQKTSDAGRLAVKGTALTHEQTEVMRQMLEPFRDLLGLDIQLVRGGLHSESVGKRPESSPLHPASTNRDQHSWLQVTYLPSMDMRVVDRAWGHADQPLAKAYSRAGDRYPNQFVGAR